MEPYTFSDNPGHRFIYKGTPVEQMPNLATTVSVAFILLTVILLVIYWNTRTRKPAILYGLFAFWALVPPLWFTFDFYYLYKRYGAPGSFDMMQYGLQISDRFWAAILALLAAIIYRDTKQS
jgi:hypothetical protein